MASRMGKLRVPPALSQHCNATGKAFSYFLLCVRLETVVRSSTSAPVNLKRSEKMGLAHTRSPPCPNARHANRAGRHRLIVSLQNSSRSPVGKSCAPASAGRSASLGEEAEVDPIRPAPLGLAVR